MSWPWFDPSAQQAEEAYSYYKNKYNSAAAQKRASERQEQNYASEKQAAINHKNTLSSQKFNLEKRLEEIESIIKMLTGTGGWFAANVPEAISKAEKALSQADSSFRSSIKLEGGSSGANLETVFSTKTVEADTRTASALQSFRNEKARLEQQISDLSTQIANLTEQINSLTKQINACNYTQASLQANMSAYAYDMNHYKKYTY